MENKALVGSRTLEVEWASRKTGDNNNNNKRTSVDSNKRISDSSKSRDNLTSNRLPNLRVRMLEDQDNNEYFAIPKWNMSVIL